MKRALLLILAVLFISGCGAAVTQSEFRQHDTVWKNWDHAEFSWSGYKNPTAETYSESQSQGWRGEAIPYIPVE
jgi:hypothetical protein